ncbi:MAG: GyrI-like domain-containing protein [Myxococcales bacterium]|nr:GyrI-like domain-containing protein [Myxococcales bacterium]
MKPATRDSYQARITRVLVHIQGHLDEALSLDALAAIACFSPYHFHRVFKAMVGESVKQHVRRLRLERAAYRLRLTDERITEIAFAAGYETHESFTRAFRETFGESPSGFRAHARPPNFPDSPNAVHYEASQRLAAFQPIQPQHSGGTHMTVQLATIDTIRVAFQRHTGPYDKAWPAWVRMLAWAERQGLSGNRRIGLSHDDPNVTDADKLRYDACVEIPAAFEPDQDVGVQAIAGGDYAILRHKGPYERLHESYARLYGDWLPSSGREPRAAPPFELNLTMPTEVAPEDLITDIYMPLAAR